MTTITATQPDTDSTEGLVQALVDGIVEQYKLKLSDEELWEEAVKIANATFDGLEQRSVGDEVAKRQLNAIVRNGVFAGSRGCAELRTHLATLVWDAYRSRFAA